mmetsp:Transcript_938/g.2595  ORF Transcript_938/g.2595 Transcript_938/m.2595 type:complete len:395 (-) Transcript_938:1445-2629(-)
MLRGKMGRSDSIRSSAGMERGGSFRNLGKAMSVRLKKPAAAVSTAGQQPFQFRFNITVQRVDKLMCDEPVYIGLFRGEKAFCTPQVMPSNATRSASFEEHPLVMEATLFRKAGEEQFSEKIFKLALKTVRGDKTIGKMHLDIAQYAAVPSGERKLGASLSNGAMAVLHLVSTLEESGRKKRGAGGSRSSGLSSAIAPSEYASSSVGGDDQLDDDDLDDLLDGEDADEVRESDASAPHNPSRALSEGDHDFALRGLLASPRGPADSARNGAAPSNGRQKTVLSKERLAKRIAYLERRNAELEEQNLSLMDTVNNGAKQGIGAASFSAENEKLRARAKELSMLIASEPEMGDLVQELKEVKVALAMVNFEKETFLLEIMKYEKAHAAKKKTSLFGK